MFFFVDLSEIFSLFSLTFVPDNLLHGICQLHMEETYCISVPKKDQLVKPVFVHLLCLSHLIKILWDVSTGRWVLYWTPILTRCHAVKCHSVCRIPHQVCYWVAGIQWTRCLIFMFPVTKWILDLEVLKGLGWNSWAARERYLTCFYITIMICFIE